MIRLVSSAVALAICGLFVGASAAMAQPASMATGPTAKGPAAAGAFCRAMPHECEPSRSKARVVILDAKRWQDLEDVNSAVNSAIADGSDRDLYGRDDVWTLPLAGRGDCEDLALLKRKRLIERGWPASTLLMTIVTTPSGEGHAVLTVVTDQGDYVLDTRRSTVALWSQTGYEFYTRQAQSNPQRWVWIETGTGSTVAGLARSPSQTAAW